MNITVCIKQVPGTTQVEIDEETGVLKRDGIESKMNPYDLYALETALQIKQERGAELTALSMGPPQAAEVIREAYMMGFDKGALLSDRKFAGSDVLATAYTLSQGIRKMGIPDIIFCGKMTTDGDTAQVGPEIAEFLDIPHVANVLSIIEIKESSIVVEMDMPGSIEVAEVKYPCLLTVDKGIFQPRLPSYKLKLKTDNWDVPFYSLDDYEDQDEANYGLNGSPTQVLKVFPPEPNTDHEQWCGNEDELCDKLFDKLTELKFI
jgi:electron transfer flavoprotein beta subunit